MQLGSFRRTLRMGSDHETADEKENEEVCGFHDGTERLSYCSGEQRNRELPMSRKIAATPETSR
jgi:hypothetical protein